ncbi:hypothetical protein K461DRAFT_290732 [Myriangium duriaei CBS 260.36]|uniref:Vps53 N-terminal domain-containing protein n=1 Tax=Myriangium duriaei CBS 260.36 TaxID=1168546 RepID=A0A9P4JBC5_9PEZI|nr:hypothetical protein K461DRAFT_290732 [Myriangium duriaei CBS 260.36]
MSRSAVAAPGDPFDAVDYNPIDHLNALFAHPSSLSSVGQVSTALRSHQNGLDRTISRRTAAQRRTDADCVSRIQSTQSELASLFAKIESVQARALETEQSITTMTAEIKRLDMTKRNLTHSMTTLKRLQMLTSAYEQLRVLKHSRQYKECAGLLAAVLQLMAHFKSYRSINQIAELSKGVADIQRELLEQVCEDFELSFAKGEIQAKRATLAEACAVIDALGDHARQRLVNWYCNTQLREYRQVFRGSEEAGSLDNIGRRYSWFNRMLKTFDQEHQGLFPREWRVNEMLANAFCEGTREDYKGILQKSMRRADGQPPDVNLLLSCLQETLDFENSLERKFKQDESRTSLDSMNSKHEKPHGFSQAISEAFEPYLSIWVESQDRQLATLIPKYRQQPIRNPEEEYHASMVMHSSTELFHSYRVTLAQCAKLSTGGRLLELSKTFAKYLDLYCQQVLLHFLTERGGPAGPSIEDIAIILNTADYCFQTTSQLEERIQSRIDEEFRSQVDLQSQADAFMGVASTAVRILVRKVEVDCDPAWREMRNISWSKLQSVGDQSPFMTSLIQRMKDRSIEVLAHLPKPQYSRAFGDNLVDALITAYITTIVASRPISETGAEQMLLDSYALKSGLTSLGTLSTVPNQTLGKRVNTSVTRLDPLLKTLQVTPHPPEALVQAYLIHMQDRSEPNFRKILELKGIRARSEVSSLVELFNAHKSSPKESSLPDSNPFLTALNLAPQGMAEQHARGPSLTSGLGMTLGAAASSPSLLSGPSSSTSARFDPASLGERLLTPLANLSTSSSPVPGSEAPGALEEGAAAVGENLRGLGRFFKRDGRGFGGSRSVTPVGSHMAGGEGGR